MYQETIKNYLCLLIHNMDYQNVEDGQKDIVDHLVTNYKIEQ